MTSKLTRGTLALALLSGAATASAQTASLIVEGAFDRPASNIPFCGPCMTLWFAGASPGAQVDFTFQQPPSAAPVVQSVKADELGLAIYPFKPSAEGEVRIQAASGLLRTSPRSCTPPLARGPRECPPPPRAPLRVQQGEAITVPLDAALEPATRLAGSPSRFGSNVSTCDMPPASQSMMQCSALPLGYTLRSDPAKASGESPMAAAPAPARAMN